MPGYLISLWGYWWDIRYVCIILNLTGSRNQKYFLLIHRYNGTKCSLGYVEKSVISNMLHNKLKDDRNILRHESCQDRIPLFFYNLSLASMGAKSSSRIAFVVWLNCCGRWYKKQATTELTCERWCVAGLLPIWYTLALFWTRGRCVFIQIMAASAKSVLFIISLKR
jgi:hypothetical protein